LLPRVIDAFVPLALPVLMVLWGGAPLGLVSATVWVRLPSVLRTVTSVRVRLNVPLPALSCCVVTDKPLPLAVVMVWPITVPWLLFLVTVSVVLALVLNTVTSVVGVWILRCAFTVFV